MSFRDWAQLILTDLACAVILGVLYSPGLIGLSLSASSPFVAALAVVAAPALVGYAVWENVQIMKPHDTRMIDTTVASAIDAGSLTERLDSYGDELYVGKLATRISDQVRKAQRRSEDYNKSIGERFGSGATAQRFSATVSTATETVVKNAAAAVNLLAATDLSSLAETMKGADRGSYAAGGETDVARRRRELYQGVLDRLGKIADGNDELLLAIEQAQIELSSLDETDETTNAALDELDRLSQSLTYYK